MGPLFVILLWAAAGGVLSVVGGTGLAGLVAFLTREVRTGRKRALLVAGCLPAIGCVYLFVCVLAFSVWSAARGRDWGWGDTWDTPILGSYHLMMIDVTDEGTVYNRADSGIYRNGSVGSLPGHQDVIFGVRRLEVRAPLLFGAASPETRSEYPVKSPETLFFVLDTRSGTRTDESSLMALQADAQRLGSPLKLEPVNEVYDQFRYGIFDLIPLTVFAIPPLAALTILTRMLMGLRKTRHLAAADPV